jgi:hypothetical protein
MDLSIVYYTSKDNGNGVPRRKKISVQENDTLIYILFVEKRILS